MHWIQFLGDRSLVINEGQSILDASLSAGIPHYHACGGKAKCSTCRILVENGAGNLSKPNNKENALKKKFSFPDNVRLACQTYVTGTPVLLHRMIRDETDMELYIESSQHSQDTGEEKNLALFFLDIRHFTPFMEKNLAFDVIHVVRRLFTIFRKSIEQHSGRIIETAGDGFYAVFGIDCDHARAINNATGAGYSILYEIKKFNQDYLLPYFRHEVAVGIGVHAGTVIIGNIGIGVNNNLTVMGLPVNIASRLQSVTRELNNNFVVSADVYDLLDPQPPGEKRNASLKGISEKVEVYLIGEAFQ